ncbi:MAG: hypothetical protein EOO09_21900 [Chitinophagaceae bacterium]|nr:MAG: hypothetical protein EOO09_21900 [Chitinophagaceae bacterium]
MVIDLRDELSNPEWQELLAAICHEYLHDEPDSIADTVLIPYDTDFPGKGILVKRFNTEGTLMHIGLEHIDGENVDQETKEAIEEDIYSFITDKLGYDNSY